MSLAAGTNLGAYRIVEQIRRGGMATVYKAYQPAASRYVAIKVLPPFLAEEEGFRERFQREAMIIARLHHPNILAVFANGEEAGLSYLVTEYVDGGELGEQLGAPLPVSYVVGMLAPIAAALDYAHAQGVLHRDIKPSNILLHRDGKPVLADFGIAKLADSSQRLTRAGSLIGTPEYMAPEQTLGQPFVAASDQYALAVVAYQMLTGRVPFSADTPMAVALAHLQKPLPLPRAVNPWISPAVEEVLLKGLAKDPHDRFPSVSAFTAALVAAGPALISASPARSRPSDVKPSPSRAAPRRLPLAASQLLEASWRMYPRQAPWLLGLSGLLTAALLALCLLLLQALPSRTGGGGFAWLSVATVGVIVVLGQFGLAGVLAGSLALALDQRSQERPTARAALNQVLGQSWGALLGTALLGGAMLMLLTCTIVGIPAAIFLGLGWSLAAPAIAVEGANGGAKGLSRGASLVRGARGRALAVLLPITVVGLLLATLLFSVLGWFVPHVGAALTSMVAVSLAGAVVLPAFSAAVAVLYDDCKARQPGEGSLPIEPSPALSAGQTVAAWQLPRS